MIILLYQQDNEPECHYHIMMNEFVGLSSSIDCYE
jgi:hypothetical protein